MRIIAGRWRGRTLAAPPGPATRPTADRVREALFSMLTSRLGGFDGLHVADLFAGTGALGLEALSRGAARCTFVEMERAALDTLRRNVATLAADADIVARPVSALGVARQAHNLLPHDLLLFDPPYGSGGAGALLERLTRLGWATPSAWASIETGIGESVSAEGWVVDAERKHGQARLTLLHRQTMVAAPADVP